MKRALLSPGREKLAINRHPWVFSGAISRLEGHPEPGEVVEVCSADGKFLAYAQFNSSSKIRLRLLEWNASTIVDDLWYEARLREAITLREPYKEQSDAMRLFFSESDGIPGLIVDRFGSWLVVQFLTAGAERIKATIVTLCRKLLPELRGIVEKSDGDGRRMEGLADSEGLLWGEDPPSPFSIVENNCSFQVNWKTQKTGFYTDQRENRRLAAPYCTNRNVLDAFCYSGGFAVMAMKHGATSVTLLDSSHEALELAAHNLDQNGFRAVETLEGDAFQLLRDLKKRGTSFGTIILDPPKLATSREHLEKALRGYKDLNLQALKLLEPGGYLVSFSCSGLVDLATFREVIAFAAKDSGRRVDIVRQLHQAPCHPIRTSMPESEYLKGVVARVI